MKLIDKESSDQMKYKDLNDNELLYMVNESDEDSYNLLFDKYQQLVTSIAYKYNNKYKNIGIDINDLIIEGNMGLDVAIKKYNSNDEQNTKFSSFAYTCIERQILNLIRNSTTKKNEILNDSLIYFEKDLGEINLDSYPLDNLLLKEKFESKYNKTLNLLTPLERKVFILKNQGYSNNELGFLLNVNQKCILNTIYRIRKKSKTIESI